MSLIYLDKAASILESDATILVCPVNCRPEGDRAGMGKGLALAFAEKWPRLIDAHRRNCATGAIEAGAVAIEWITPAQAVALAATKDDWANRSRVEWVESILADLPEFVMTLPQGGADLPLTVALPALGCGLGGLHWPRVQELIEAMAATFPVVEWRVYPPRSRR